MDEWIREQMLTILKDEQMIDHIMTGGYQHAERRTREMTAVVQMLSELGLDSFTSKASIQQLTDIQSQKEKQCR